MKKSDLKFGTLVELRNGTTRFYDELLSVFYDDNLYFECDKDLDIIKVYKLETIWQRKERPKLSKEDIELLKAIKLLFPEMRWVARDKDNCLYMFHLKPNKLEDEWYGGFFQQYMSYRKQINEENFEFIKWEDTEPYNIDELLKENE